MSKRIIYGGNFVNKGAEALTFSAVDLLRKKFPDDEPVLLNLFPTKFGDEKNKYDFQIVNMHIRTLFRLQFPFLKPFLKKSPKSDEEKEIILLFEDAKGFYDISGYGVSSHNQHIVWTLAAIFPVFWAKKRNIPVVLLPQSLGPFNFKGWKKLFIKTLIKRYINIPETIFIREEKNITDIENIRKNNVFVSHDIVLLNPLKIKTETENSIAVIPNRQLTSFLPLIEVAKIFSSIIEKINQNGYNVHLFAHATDDFNLCKTIFENINDKEKVTYHDKDFSVKETEEIISRMKGVVTARYHGLVHALRAGKPSMAIGWATKYSSLLDAVDQLDYYYDLSLNKEVENIYKILDNWLENGLNNSDTIIQKVKEIQEKSNLIEYL